MSGAGRPERTIHSSDWRDTIRDVKNSLSYEAINSAVWRAMAELKPITSTSYYSAVPWLPISQSLRGAMWAGVPGAGRLYRDKGGGWSTTPASAGGPILRLCPAEADGEVQYGFCVVRLSRFDEIAARTLGPAGEWKISRASPSITRHGFLRVDQVAAAVVDLGDPGNTSEEANRFKYLLGSTPLPGFIRDTLRGCFHDGFARDILRDRDAKYVEMIQIICEYLCPGFMNDRSPKGIERFRQLMGMEGCREWNMESLFPYVFNIVMPPGLLNSVGENLEKGIPPIVPQYMASGTWMFNGTQGDACTHLTISEEIRADPAGHKLLAGVLNKFNLDLNGPTSYWPVAYNPPGGWTETFIERVRELGDLATPLSISDRGDLALEVARRIPVMLIVSSDGAARKWFARLTSSQVDRGFLTSATIKQCDETGQELEQVVPENLATATPQTSPALYDVYHCNLCEGDYPSEEISGCSLCEEPTCVNCFTTCPGCGEELCGECIYNHPGCRRCAYCKNITLATDLGGGGMCDTCNRNRERRHEDEEEE